MGHAPDRKGDAREKIEAAMGRRAETFTLSHLAWSSAGYTLKFRLGIVDIVRTTVAEGVFEDDVRLNKLLDGVRSDFASLLGRS
jgi:hypothetical protein